MTLRVCTLRAEVLLVTLPCAVLSFCLSLDDEKRKSAIPHDFHVMTFRLAGDHCLQHVTRCHPEWVGWMLNVRVLQTLCCRAPVQRTGPHTNISRKVFLAPFTVFLLFG